MRRSLFHMPSPSMVVSLIALFVALGGSGYAAVTLQKNSVGSAQIKRGAVKNSDIAKNAVTSAKVKDGSLLSADFKPGQLPAGSTGAQGAKGDTGAQGAKGDTGAQGLAGNTGPAGPTAAAKASKDFAPSVILGPSSGTNVIDLDTPGAGAARLHMTFSGRVVTDAIVNVYNETSSVQTINCSIGRMNAGNTAVTESGKSEWQTLTAGANTYESMPLNAAFDLPAGDYNFRVVCSQIGGSSNDTAVDDATLTVVAVAN